MKKPRAQLKHALIRVNLLNLAKVRALKRLYGITSKLALLEIYLTMSCATNAVISKDAILDIADDCEVKDPDGFFKYCLQEGLIQAEMNGYSNSVVIEDQESYAKKLKMKPTEEEPDEPPMLPTIPGNNPGKSPAECGLPESDNDTDSDNESKKETVILTAVISSLDKPECRDALTRWIAYQAQQHKTEMSEMAIGSFQQLYTGRPDELVRDVNYTISQGWKSICIAKEAGKNTNGPPKYESFQERRERERQELRDKVAREEL